MSLHANRGLYQKAVLHARQDTTISKVRVTPRLPTSTPSSSRTTTSSATSILRLSSSTSVSRTTTSSSLVSSPSSISRVIVSTPQVTGGLPFSTTTTSSRSSVSSSVPTAASATAKKTRKGSLAVIIIGILVAIIVIIIIAIFVTRRLRKRRKRQDEAHVFNKDMLERPGMVQGIAAGPGVGSLNDVGSMNASQSSNIEKTLLPPSSPFDTSRNVVDVPASPYGSGNPYSSVPHTGSSYYFNQSQLELGAPPLPGNDSPAPYSPYMTNFYKYAPPSQNTPPGSPFVGGDRMQNPFATPSATDTHPSTPTAVAWPNTPTGNYHLPLLPGGVFSNDSYRDSGYSAAFSEVHVGQAYKVQVGHSMPKYEEVTNNTTTTTTKDTPGSPPPPFTPIDPAAAASANTANPGYPGPSTMVDKKTAAHKSLPPRPISTHTIYNPEDAYGGV